MDDLCWLSPEDPWPPEEMMWQYQPGGYHPVSLGDSFKDGRYTIRHKLGLGRDSTIWVAHDSTLSDWVSIKIKTAERTEISQELKILKDLQACSEERDRDYVVQLLDDFCIHGPNGRHQALVFEMMGPTVHLDIQDMVNLSERLPACEILYASSQLLQALDFVHKAGHTHGDLDLTSLVHTSKHFSGMSQEDLYKMLGAPEAVPWEESGSRPDTLGAPEHIIRSAGWDGWPLEEGDNEFEADQRLRLFGFEEVSVKHYTGSHPYYRDAPWATVGDCVDYRADLWAAGVFMYLLIFPQNQPVITGLEYCTEVRRWDAPEFPWRWVEKWESFELKVPAQSGFMAHGPLMSPHWELRFRDDIHHPILVPLLRVIKNLMRVLPWERTSATQALTSLQIGSQGIERWSKL